MSDSNSEETVNQMAAWLAVLVAPDSTVEMRVLFEDKSPIIQHYASTDLRRMASDASRLGKGAKGVYWTLNPLPADWKGKSAKDKDIVRRRWLLVDCDPKREGTVSSTDAEKSLAEAKAKAVHAFLKKQGWPRPIIADSGNGWHLLYLIDLPTEDEKLVWRVLKAVAQGFSDVAVDIDVKVGNASRICKLYGTSAAKGENTPERPHRVSKIVKLPTALEVVPTELLHKLASELVEVNQPPAPPTRHSSRPETGGRPDTGGRPSRPEAVEQARRYLATMDPSIAGERGHDKLLKAASKLVNNFRLTDTEACELLTTEFNPRCVPPWDEHDIRRKISEAKKNPPNLPPKGPARHSGNGFDAHMEAVLVRLSEVVEQEVEWLWPNRIPIGKLTLLAGDPGLGKSFVTVDMAARVSTGASWPDCSTTPQPVGSVVLFNCEDDIADTVLPRLKRAGGDPSKVVALQGICLTDDEGRQQQRGFSLDRDLPALIEVLRSIPDARLVVIDPISAYCGQTDSHNNTDVRGMLAPLAELASQYRVAIVMVTHLAKGKGNKSVYRAMGSLAFAAAARAVWCVAKDHRDDSRRLILMAKMNVCQESAGLAYRLSDGVVCWDEVPVQMTADEHLEQENQPVRQSSGLGKAVAYAVKWLTETLSGGPILATEIEQLAHDADISESTLKRAKKKAGITSRREGFGTDAVFRWFLPETDDISSAAVIEPMP